MLEQIVNNERRTRLARYHPSSEDIFADNESFNYLVSNILSTNQQKGWKRAVLTGLKGVSYAGYGLLEGVSRISETGLRLTGRGIESLGSIINRSIQGIDETKYQHREEIVKTKSFFERIGSFYENVKQGTRSAFSERQRNKAMVGLALLTGLYTGGKILSPSEEGYIPEPTPITQPYQLPENRRIQPPQPIPQATNLVQIPVHNIESFNDQHVLIYCANDDERRSVRDNFRAIGIRLRGSDGRYNTQYNGSRVDVVVQGNNIPRRDYGLIQLRGHTSNMMDLAHEVENVRRNNSILMLGGCDSTQFIDDLARPNRPVIASNGSQNNSQNTYLLGQVLGDIGSARTWQEMSSEIKRNSENAARDTTFPGDSSYVRNVSYTPMNIQVSRNN